MPAAAANGDRYGHGNGNAYGHGRGGGPSAGAPRNPGHGVRPPLPAAPSGTSRPPQPPRAPQPVAAPTRAPVAAPVTTRSPGRGNGNGNGHGHGHAYGHANTPAVAAPTRTSSPPASAASSPPPAPTPAPTPAVTPPVVVAPPAPAAPVRPHAVAGGPSGRFSRVRTVRPGSAPVAVGALGATASPLAPLALATAPVAASRPSAGSPARDKQSAKAPAPEAHDNPPAVVRTLRLVVERIPTFVKALIIVLGSLLLIAAIAWALLARTTRFLRRQREHLLGEIGVLQGALLPNVPAELSRLQASVAYRPAEGLAAGGDFYDAFPLGEGRVGIVVGDVAGHGKEALMHTSLLRYTLRAYLEADLEPRVALQLAGRALDRGFDTLATVVLAVYDPARHILRYAGAGHPPPVFLGEPDHVPVTQASAPPIGTGVPTGLRQTTVSLPSGSAVCFFTDGLIEARRGGALIGRLGLVDIIRELGPAATARELLDRVAREADQVSDDMAACMFRVSEGPNEGHMPRVEELEVRRDEEFEPILRRFLEACGLEQDGIERALLRTERAVRQFRGAVVRVSLPRGGPRVEVGPANVESLARSRAA